MTNEIFYYRCKRCSGFFINGIHSCITESKIMLDDIKKVFKEIGSTDNNVMVASNGIFFHSDMVYVQIYDNYKLNCGVHDLHTLGSNKVRISKDMSDFKFPKVVAFDNITINWKHELMKLDLPFNALTVFLWLLLKYEVSATIELAVNDDFMEYRGKDFKLIVRGEWTLKM